MRTVLLLAMGLAGCDGIDREHVQHRGSVCAYASEGLALRNASQEPQHFPSGSSVALSYWAQPRTNDCPLEIYADCRVELGPNPDELIVDAYVAWNEQPGALCSREIHAGSAHCVTPVLFKGTYTIVYQDQRMLLQVPSSTTESPCLHQL